MIASKDILADFQLVENKITHFKLEGKGNYASLNSDLEYDFDYNIVNIEENDEGFLGLIEFIVLAKAKEKNTMLFKISLKMEGTFLGNKNFIDYEEFQKMLQLNGVASLSQLSRAYILSVSALSGINPPIKLPMFNVFSLYEKKHEPELINAGS